MHLVPHSHTGYYPTEKKITQQIAGNKIGELNVVANWPSIVHYAHGVKLQEIKNHVIA